MDREYDLKKSEEAVGQLLPIIKDAHGNIVDGLHRATTDPSWRTEIRDEITTEEDYWKARAHLNYSRRDAHEAKQEKIRIINSLAEYYLKQGLEVTSRKPLKRSRGIGGGGENEVLSAVIKSLDGAILPGYIRKNIDSKFTQYQKPREVPSLEEETENEEEPLESEPENINGVELEMAENEKTMQELVDEIDIVEEGHRIGKEMGEAQLKLEKLQKKYSKKPVYWLRLSINSIITKQEKKEIYCPSHPESKLIWDCGEKLEDTLKQINKLIGEENAP